MEKKIKVCVIPSTFLPIIGGAEIQCHNFSNLLSQKKIDVDLWSLKKINIKNNIYKIKFFNMFLINITYYLEYYFFINSNCLMIIKSIVLLISVSNSMVMNVSKIGFKDADKKQMKGEHSEHIKTYTIKLEDTFCLSQKCCTTTPDRRSCCRED